MILCIILCLIVNDIYINFCSGISINACKSKKILSFVFEAHSTLDKFKKSFFGLALTLLYFFKKKDTCINFFGGHSGVQIQSSS